VLVAGHVLVAVLIATGLAGAVTPFLPGTPLILAGALLHAVLTDFAPIGAGRLAILALLTVVAESLDYLGGALGARRFGASRWGMLGAAAGALIGLLFGLPGLLLGALLGSTLAELLHRRRIEASLRAGAGTVLGLALGALGKIVIAVAMAGLVLWWIWRG
jgi:hypothetical protein